MINEISNILKKQGYFWTDQGSKNIADTISSKLGNILQTFPVKVSKRPSTIIESEKSMKFHIDTPAARYVVWFCEEEGLKGEDLVLVDLTDINETFSSSEIDELCSTRVSLPKGYGREKTIFSKYNGPALLERVDTDILINYTDWLIIDWGDTNLKLKFENYLTQKKSIAQKIFLKRGDIFILDNRRFIHSRTKLNKETKRCHIRYLVAS
jgi:hypothetical protein